MAPSGASAAIVPDLPPYSNRGVTLVPGDGLPVLDACFGTVFSHPWPVLDHLEQALMDGGFEPRREDGPRVRFYATNTLLLNPEGGRLLSVRHGGQNHHPFVEAKGSPLSGIVADCLRSEFDYVPARLDSAYDLHGPGVFEELHRIAKLFEVQGRNLDYAGAAIENQDRGTTIYLGSRKSEAFVRIYQKGLKLAQELGLVGDQISDELRYWVRVELEYKPDKRPARMKARDLSPSELWGCSQWVREFAKLALSIDAKRVHMHERRETDLERSQRAMFKMFGSTILATVEQLGSWDAFMEFCQARLAVEPELTH